MARLAPHKFPTRLLRLPKKGCKNTTLPKRCALENFSLENRHKVLQTKNGTGFFFKLSNINLRMLITTKLHVLLFLIMILKINYTCYLLSIYFHVYVCTSIYIVTCSITTDKWGKRLVLPMLTRIVGKQFAGGLVTR